MVDDFGRDEVAGFIARLRSASKTYAYGITFVALYYCFESTTNPARAQLRNPVFRKVHARSA